MDVTIFALIKNYVDKKIAAIHPSTPSITDYKELNNKPSINGKELIDNLTSDEIGVSSNTHKHDNLYASKNLEHSHSNKTILDSITDEKIKKWDEKLKIEVTSDGVLVIN